MAILQRGFNQTKLNGSVGAVTYVHRAGVTIAKEKVPAKWNGKRTVRGMTQRVKWGNGVRLWQILNQPGWHPSFPSEGLVSDFNMFMKRNNVLLPYVDKQIVDAKGVVLFPAIVSEGELSSVTGTYDTDRIVTSIALGGTTIGASTTLATFSQAILDNNTNIRENDMLTIVVITTDEYKQVTSAKAYRLPLDPSAEDILLGDNIDPNVMAAQDDKLCIMAGANTLTAAAVILSRETAAGTAVSSEQFALTTAAANAYTMAMTNNALLTAIDTYGGLSASQFLQPISSSELVP